MINYFKKLNSLYFKILSYFLSLLIPIIVVGIVTCIYFTNYYKLDFDDKIIRNLDSSIKHLDYYISSSHKANLNLLEDTSIKKYLKPFNLLSLNEKAEVYKIPSVIHNNSRLISEFIDNSFIYIDNEKVYTGEGIDDFDAFFLRYYKMEDYDIEFWKNKLRDSTYFKTYKPTYVYKANDIKRRVLPIVSVDKLNGYNIQMVLTISIDKIIEIVNSNMFFNTSKFVITNNENSIIASNDNELFSQNTLNYLQTKGELKKPITVNIHSKKMILAYSESANYGWKYYCLLPISEYQKSVKAIVVMTAISCSILLIAGLIFSMVFATKIYNPIKSIKDIITSESTIIASNVPYKTNEFKAIGNGINNVVCNLNDKVVSLTDQYLQSSFLNIFKGHNITNIGNFIKVLREKAGFEGNTYMCCSIQVEYTETFYKTFQDVDRLGVSNGIKMILDTVIAEQLKSYILEYKQDIYICIINLNTHEDKKLLMLALQNFIDLLKYDIDYYSISIGIGGAYNNILELKKSFSESMTVLDKKNKDLKFQILDSQNVFVEHRYCFTSNDKRKIFNCIDAFDIAKLQQTVENIVLENKQKGVGYMSIELLFEELFDTAIKYISEKGFDINEFIKYKEDYISERDTAEFSFEQKIKILTDLYSDIVHTVSKETCHETGSLVTVISQYVEENYHRDICLEKIAGSIGLSVKYVSRVFKEKTGTNLTDFISNLRISKAKELLINTNMNIEDIYNNIGIVSRTTFIRMFKKYEGVTPSQYRDNQKNKKNI